MPAALRFSMPVGLPVMLATEIALEKWLGNEINARPPARWVGGIVAIAAAIWFLLTFGPVVAFWT
jgi:hypothetical protein